MPEVGEVRSANGETRQWDGSAWRLKEAPPQGVLSSLKSIASPAGLQGLKDYGSELVSGKGTARSEAANFGMKEGKSFLSTLNPINQVKGIANVLTTDPRETARGLASTAGNALTGDPEAIGSVLGMAAMPKANAGLLRGVNSAASAVASNPAVRSGIGYVGGAGTALATGAGHPFMGAAVGRLVSPLLKGPAQEVANGSSWLMNKLGMNGEVASPAGDTSGLKPADLSMLQQIESRNQAIDARQAAAPKNIANASPFEAEFPMGPDASKPTPPRMKFTGADVVRIQRLMEQGVSPEDAAARVSGTSALSRLVKIGPETP